MPPHYRIRSNTQGVAREEREIVCKVSRSCSDYGGKPLPAFYKHINSRQATLLCPHKVI
jgi:hypothetical protein